MTHRWLSLLLGVLLLVIMTTGALLLYRPEIEGRLHHSTYQATPSPHPLTLEQAAEPSCAPISADHRA